MASFVELDENNVVIRGIVVDNSVLLDQNGIEQESLGKAFCVGLLGGKWVQTSYNARSRGVYAGIGFHYNETEDEFFPPGFKNRHEYSTFLEIMAQEAKNVLDKSAEIDNSPQTP